MVQPGQVYLVLLVSGSRALSSEFVPRTGRYADFGTSIWIRVKNHPIWQLGNCCCPRVHSCRCSCWFSRGGVVPECLRKCRMLFDWHKHRMGPCLSQGCCHHSSSSSCGNQLATAYHALLLSYLAFWMVHASMVPVYGIALYLELAFLMDAPVSGPR